MEQSNKNIVIIGDGYVGKTSILYAIDGRKFDDHIPNVYDDVDVVETIKGKKYKLKFIDTAGQEEFALIRELSYKEANLFLLCFAVDDKVSYENMTTKWMADLQQYQNVPIVLVGTKCDLRKIRPGCINRDEIVRFQKNIGALFYIECSAKTLIGIEDLKKKTLKILTNDRSCVIQ